MTTTTSTGGRTARAAEIGREHREAYLAEFGEVPTPGRVGDWDATGLGEMWRVLRQEGMAPTREYREPYPYSPRDEGYEVCKEAYLAALFGTPTKVATRYELAVQQSGGVWEHLGDYDTEEAAVEAAKVWAKDTGESSPVWHDDFGTAVFGISGDPHSGHYETRVEFYEDGDFQVL